MMTPANHPATPTLRLDPRQKYLALTLTAFQRAIAYRGTTFLNIISQLIWAAVLYYLWRTVFATRAEIVGYTWQEMRTYIVISYAIGTLISFYSMARMTSAVRTGEIATDLLRPVDYLGMQLAQTFGAALIEGLFSSAIAFVLGVFLLHIALPHSLLVALLFLVSVWLGFLIKFLISFLVALLCFRTLNAIGLIWAQTAVIELLSGALIPLQFFPDWLRTLALVMPFGGIVYTPLTIYLGKVQDSAAWQALGIQALWILALWGLARLLWAPSLRALDIQGG